MLMSGRFCSLSDIYTIVHLYCLCCFTLDFSVFMAGSEKLAMKRIMVTGGNGLVGSAINSIVSHEESREDEEWIFVSACDTDLTYVLFVYL